MEINYAKDKMKLQGSDSMAATEKTQKMAEIDKQLTEIRSYTELIEKFN
jgi:hypothetical protein